MGRRLRIWEVDCTLLDAVLALSFDTEELLNCCFSAGVPIAACPQLRRGHRVRVAVHRACHGDNALARLIERRLDYVHGLVGRDGPASGAPARAPGEAPAAGPARGGAHAGLLGSDLTSMPELAARLWALARDGSAAASTLRAKVAASVVQTGHDLLAQAVAAQAERSRVTV